MYDLYILLDRIKFMKMDQNRENGKILVKEYKYLVIQDKEVLQEVQRGDDS